MTVARLLASRPISVCYGGARVARRPARFCQETGRALTVLQAPPSAFGRTAQLAASAPTRCPSPSNRRFDGAGWDPMRHMAHPPVAHRTGVPMGVLTSPARSSGPNSRQPRLVMQGC